MILLLSTAWAQDPAADEPAPALPTEDSAPRQGAAEHPDDPRTIEIAPVEEPLPSALDALDEAADEVELEPIPADLLAGIQGSLARNLVRGKPFVRPVLGLAAHHGVAARVGGAVGHTWWTLADLPVRVGGETVLRATAPIGAARGWRVDLGTQTGPWLGPVSVWAGPLLRAEREAWGEEVLPAAVLVGGSIELAVDAGPVGLLLGVQPLGSLSAARSPAAPGLLPALGAETTWRAGVRATFGQDEVTLELADRETALGPVVEVGVGLKVRMF